MSTIQMDSKTGMTGTLTIPAPSGAQVSVTNGIASVNAVDVPVALQAGWVILAGQAWPGAMVVAMYIPPSTVGAAWPASGTVTLPDGSTITTNGGVGMVPAWAVAYLKQFGWAVK